MAVAQKPVTAEDLLTMPVGVRRKLVEGEAREMAPAGNVRGRIAARLLARLFQHVEDRTLGTVFAAETGFEIASNPDTVRAPDAAFVRRERAEEFGEVQGYWPGAPDLAVEVISPDDSYAGVEEKVASWLDAGARAVVVLEPRTGTVSVRPSRTEIRVLAEGGVLGLGAVVPRFSTPVADVFG